MPAMTKAMQAAHARATARLHAWVESKIARDAEGLVRLYRAGQAELDDKLRSIYFTYLAEEPTFVRARMTGALGALDAAVDETISEVTRKIYDKTRTDMAAMLAAQSGKAKRTLRALDKVLKLATLVPTAEQVVNALTTDVVVGGTYADRLFHISSKVRGDVTREIRQGLFNRESFDEVRARVHRVFGVDRLRTPKSHSSGSVKIYKNEARRQWNLLMKEINRQSAGVAVWFTLLDEDATPGCVARHGMKLDDMDDDTIPHHPNCRCTVMVVTPDFDLGDMKLEGSAWLKSQGWSRKEALFEESAYRPILAVRPLRETWERWPGLRLHTFMPRATLAVVDRAQADQLMTGTDPGVTWHRGDPRVVLEAGLRDTTVQDPIVAVGRSLRRWEPLEVGLSALVEARSGRVLYRARESKESDGYTRAVCLVGDKGFVWAVTHPDYPHWTLPGGHVEEDEDPKAAAAREFGEETGREVQITKYLGEYELLMSTGEMTNNMLYEGELTGNKFGNAVEQTEIADVKRVHVVDLDQKERPEVERLWFQANSQPELTTREADDVTHTLRSGAITAYPAAGPRGRIVIAAPHGDTDTGTGTIVEKLRHRLECSAVIAEGFDPADNGGERLNINRPTEGISKDPHRGEDATAEKATAQAAKVYKAWASAVLQAANFQRPALYVEIHDNDYPSTQDHLEVATVGVTPEQALRIKRSWESLDTSLGIKIEPLDEVEWRGIVAKHIGIFKHLRPCVQVELPEKLCSLAAAGQHGAIEELEDWLEDVFATLL